MRWWTVFGLIVLFVVRVDLWWWNDSRLIGALPVGLAFHIGYCFVVSACFFLIVKRCWPKGLDDVESESETATGARP